VKPQQSERGASSSCEHHRRNMTAWSIQHEAAILCFVIGSDGGFFAQTGGTPVAGRFFSLGTQASAAGSVIAKWRHSVSSGRCRCVGSRLLQLFVAVVVRFHGKIQSSLQALNRASLPLAEYRH
jgi:hypothetical protein